MPSADPLRGHQAHAMCFFLLPNPGTLALDLSALRQGPTAANNTDLLMCAGAHRRHAAYALGGGGGASLFRIKGMERRTLPEATEPISDPNSDQHPRQGDPGATKVRA